MCLQSGLYKLERGLFWLFSSKQVLIENGWKVILPLKLCKLFFFRWRTCSWLWCSRLIWLPSERPFSSPWRTCSLSAGNKHLVSLSSRVLWRSSRYARDHMLTLSTLVNPMFIWCCSKDRCTLVSYFQICFPLQLLSFTLNFCSINVTW